MPVVSWRGFTLVEMLIALVVVAILAAIALPAYNDAIRKSRRSDATSALATVQQAQERWRNTHSSYAASASDLGVSTTSPGGYYTLAIASAGATGYVLTATAVSGSSQAADSGCACMSVRLQNGALAYAGGGSCEGLTYSATQACWAH